MGKKILLVTTIFVLIISGCVKPENKKYTKLGKDQKFTVEGTITNGEGKKLYLQKVSYNSNEILDSAIIDAKQQFNIKGTSNYPNLFILRAESGPFLVICIRGGENIQVTADYNDFANYSLTGSKESEKILEYNKETNEVLNKIGQLSKISEDSIDSPNYSTLKTKLIKDFDDLFADFRSYSKDFIKENSNSLISILALKKQIGPQMPVFNLSEDTELFLHADSVLMSVYPKSELVNSFHNENTTFLSQVETEKPSSSLSPGQLVPDISLPSPEGKIISLSSLKGKYVLLDFWAAWCPPCRAENPNLVANYKKYQSEGFEIYQVSLDRTKEAWLKGIKEDNLDWIHVSDLKYWDSSVVPLYGIQGIPTNYLLDTKGKIIDSNLRGDQLGAALQKIFNK